jgi:formiminoglutamase
MIEDFKNIKNQLSSRKEDRIEREFKNEDPAPLISHILSSPNDLGVCRNGGRRGAAYGPDAIINCLKKMAPHCNQEDENRRHKVSTVCNNKLSDNFYEFQKDSTHLIEKAMQEDSKSIIHIGGGHDHIYPFLKSLDSKDKRIIVLNIDAHLDTRTDESSHSGTPFRQFSKEAMAEFHLIQIGIHKYANAPSNFKKLPSGIMTYFTLDEIQTETDNFSKPIDSFLDEILPDFDEDKDLLVVSLDCDALDSSCMEGVSAVNHNGFPLHTIKEVFNYCNYKRPQKTNLIGVYEYNPVYDNLSQKGARALASLLYPYFK